MAATTRTSTLISRFPPSRVKVASWSTCSSLACARGAHLGDLVEEERAALGPLELAGLARDRAREGAAFVAEQLALEQLARQRRAVHLDEGTLPAARRRVERARDDLLAGAALALDQHGHVRLGHTLDQRAHLAERGALPERPRQCRSSAAPAPRRTRCARARARSPARARLRRRACSGSRSLRRASHRRWSRALPTTDTMTTGRRGARSRMRRRVSSPSSPGIITSSSTRSGAAPPSIKPSARRPSSAVSTRWPRAPSKLAR